MGPPNLAPVRRVELLMALAIFCIGGTVLHPWSAQPASRYLLTVAVVDHHTVSLDQDRHLLGVDQAEFEGHSYSDKAPYQPLLAAPFYQAFRAVGGDAFPADDQVLGTDGPFHWGRWWVTVWSATVPAILLSIVVRRLVLTVRPSVATPVALALSLGTMLLPFAGELFGHVLAALFLTSAWLLIRRPAVDTKVMLGAGLLLSAAVGTEYPVVIPAVVMVIAAITAHGWRSNVALTLGGLAGAVPMLAYHWLVFESPFTTAYQGHMPNFPTSGALKIYNLAVPQGDELVKALVGDRGLFTLAPVCALACGFAVLAITGSTRTRRDGVIALVALGSLWVVSAGIDAYGGWSPGPRYLIPVLPLLAVPLAEAWARLPRLCTLAALVGTVSMLLATITDPEVPTGVDKPIRLWFDMLLDGRVARSVPGEMLGDAGLFVVIAVGVGAAVAALHSDSPIEPEPAGERQPVSAGGPEAGHATLG